MRGLNPEAAHDLDLILATPIDALSLARSHHVPLVAFTFQTCHVDCVIS